MKEKINHILLLPLVKTIFSVALIFLPYFSISQCTTTISNFPYKEDFETSGGSWVAGGTYSDWTWGTPSKPVINSAGSGSKCWITGGLKNPGYNNQENAWLKSPCFNFTNLKAPYLKFKVFWETEGKFDGANLEFSTDNGLTWQLLGNKIETNGCLTERWYNDGPILSLGNKDAWSGNIQSSRPGCFVSGGSAGWVTAKHHVPSLAGNPNVIFRFVFASNESCNNFDGFAIDDFSIEEAPPSTASFSYNCSSNLRVNFVSQSTSCPTSFLWNFGDPSSGANNASTDPNPTHAYTSGGNYNVSLTVFGPGNNSSTFTLFGLEIIENIVASIVTPIRCHDDTTGSLTVNFVGDSSSITYSWDTDPVQTTRTAVHLGAGDYNATILNADGCPASVHISLEAPPPMLYTVKMVKPNCTVSNGSIDIAMSGGLAPYSYTWLPNVSAASSAKNLASGAYTISVVDENLCYKTIHVDLSDSSNLDVTISNINDVNCFGGNNGTAIATATGGNKPYSYAWPSSGGNMATNINLAAGNHTVIVTDANGCKAIASTIVHQPPALSSTIKRQNTFCGNDNGTASVVVNGGTGPYQYTWSPGNSTNPSVSNLAPGQYTVMIKDNNGCIKTDTANIASSSPMQLELSHTNVLCPGEQTGTAKAFVTGGTPPYNFQWTNDTEIFHENPIINVGAGIYNLKLKDTAGCSVTASVTITEPEVLKISITTEHSYCALSNGSATAAVSGGSSPYTFLWTPYNNTTETLDKVPPGDYQLSVADQNNCKASTMATILNDEPQPIFLGNDTTLCPGNHIILSPGTYKSYKWQDHSAFANYTVINAGTYAVEVMDDRNCILRDTIEIISDCGFIFFPNAFTPNNDFKNDYFGPLGYLRTVTDYTLLIYNRHGQLVFKSTDPFKKWDGRMRDGTIMTGTFVWLATYSNKGKKDILQKGTVTVIH
jgi:gliding motility-associated-like protein